MQFWIASCVCTLMKPLRLSLRLLGTLLLAAVLTPTVAAAAHAQESACARAVIFTLPGVMWEDVDRVEPPALLGLVERGAAGSMSVRTNRSRTSYGDGFITLGGGARLDGGVTSGTPSDLGTVEGHLMRDVSMPVDAQLDLAEEAGYGAAPGALGTALGDTPLIAIGNGDLGRPAPAPGGAGRWALLTAMNREGEVPLSATGPDLLALDESWPFGVRTDPTAIREAAGAGLDVACASMVIDQGDLGRADNLAQQTFSRQLPARARALTAADELLGYVVDRLDFERDLLIVVSPTSPAGLPFAHLGVVVAAGPSYPAGDTLQSPSTRRRGVVTLPDVAPTVLDHLGIEQPGEMNGRPWTATAPGRADRMAAAIELDRESVFVDRLKGPISTWFVIAQVVVYGLALGLLAWRERRLSNGSTGFLLGRWLEIAALAVVAFPISTFFAGLVKAHVLDVLGFAALLIAIDVVLVVAASTIVTAPLDRLLVLTGLTFAALAIDLMTGSVLQLNTVLGYSPIVAGRFAGAGNIAFAILGVSTVLTGALALNRWPGRRTLWAVGGLFALAVLIDGAPAFGSDVGGVLALVPALLFTWVLLSGRRPSARVLVIGGAAAVAILGLFVAVDLAGPPESRTHLGRLVEDIRARGPEVFIETLQRKLGSNLRVFRTTIWTFFVPPALVALAWLLARPRGRWGRLAELYPKVRAGLLGGLLVAMLGFMVNDSGIVIPAVVLSFLVPLAMIVHLMIEMKTPGPDRQAEPERVLH